MTNEYDALLSGSEYDATVAQQDQRSRLRQTMFGALDSNPDQYAEAKRLSRATGLPAPVVERNLPEVQKKAALNDYDALVGTPLGEKMISDADFARLARDDIDTLGSMADVVKPAGKRVVRGDEFAVLVRELKQRHPGMTWDDARFAASQQVEVNNTDPMIQPSPPRSGLAGIIEPIRRGFARARQSATIIASEMGLYNNAPAEFGVRLADQQRGIERFPVPEDIAKGMQSISGAMTMPEAVAAALANPRAVLEVSLESMGTSAPALALAAAGSVAGPGGTAAGAGLGSLAIEYSSVINEVLTEGGTSFSDPEALVKAFNDPEKMAAAREKAIKRGIPIAAFDALTAGLAGRLLRGAKPTVGSVASRVAGEAGLQAGGGAAGEAVAQAATGEYKPGDILLEALAEIPSGAVEVYGNVRTARAAGEAKVQAAEADAAAFERLAELSKASKLQQRDPQSFEQYVNEAAADGPVQDVYVNAAVFAQSMGEQIGAVTAASPAVAEQLQEALASNGDLVIPVGEFAAYIAPADTGNTLLPHLRTSADAMSQAEAQTFMQGQAEEMRAETERIMAEHEFTSAVKESAATVERELRTQLQQTNRFTDDVNGAYAKLMSAFYAVQSARLGITPEQMYVKYPLRIQAEGVTGARVMDQRRRPADDATPLTAGPFAGVSREQSKGSPEAASRYLAGIGIPGIKYLDHGSRGGPLDTKGTRNLVVFDDKIIKLTHKDGTPVTAKERAEFMQQTAGANARGQISFGADITETPSVLTLLKNADLTTFLHEMGHFQLEVLADIASQPDAPAEIVADMAAVLKWFGVPDLATWQGMTIEQKRTHHEKFARGFEAYLFEGKSPSVEMAGLFARFRAWMLNVYRQLTSLNAELTDEVRGVMDRLLATNEEIVEAEAARSYAPLFKSAEEAGMTAAEWKAYQALGQDATQEAVDQLQTRSLRDMQYALNAHGRVVRELQREAAAKRREVRIEARREVLSEPVYQAWQFLTRRLGPDDKLPPSAPPKRRTDVVDEFSDSLLEAIAKLGGLDKDAVIAEWGTDPKDMPRSRVFGKPIWRPDGGRSIDDMATSLAQYGYFDLDDSGKVNLADFEEKFGAELRGEPQYSNAYDYARDQPVRPGDQIANPAGLLAARFDEAGLRDINLPTEIIEHLQNLRMTAKEGLHPDIVAELFGFTSGDDLARTLAATERPAEAIEALTDQRMLERYGDLADERAIKRAASEAIHNDVRARFITTELNALNKAVGERRVLAKAAKDFAAQIIARKKVRDIRPSQYAAAEARAARGAERAKSIVEKATEKRNQLVNHYAARAALDAVGEVEKGVRYLKKFDEEGTRKKLDPDYRDQIDALLERFDLRRVTNKDAAKRAALADWIKTQEEQGLDPVISDELRNEASRKPYREMSIEEFRGLVDAVKNIEHLARLKHKLLTLKDKREFEAVVGDLSRSIRDNAKGTVAERRTSDRGLLVSAGQLFRNFFADHRKFASLAREMDGWQDDGTAWNTLVRNMNDAGNFEAVEREKSTIKLTELLGPVMQAGKLTAKQYFPTIGKSFTREERIGIALNMGNEANRERVLTGEKLAPQQLQAVLDTLTKADWDFVQGVWDYLESFRPQIAAKERRLTGVEPEWVEASPVVTKHGTYRGGYYPIKADPLRSTRAEADTAAEVQRQIERGAYARAQTRRGHLKARSESTGRPIRYDLNVIVEHVDQVVHDLAWHEYLIDANRVMRAGAVDAAIREHYGAEKLRTMKDTLTDIAIGDIGAQSAAERVLNHLRHGATIAGLGWRVTTSLLQPLGLTQSVVRIGPQWVAKGAVHWLGDTAKMQNSVRLVGEKSDFMRLRAKTMQREINEIRNKVAGADSRLEASYFYLIQKMQLVADLPTWWGAYEKAMAADGMTEAKAVALADQAVIDAQGGGQIKDLAAVQRGSPAWRLFTNFYSFFNTTYNLTAESVGRTDFKSVSSVALLATDMLLLYTVPAILGTLMKAALKGEWDDEDKLLRQLIADQLSYLLGTVVVLREIGASAQAALGLPGGYSGPAGVRFFGEVTKLVKQAQQGEADAAFWKALNSAAGVLFHYPAGQINATAEGMAAMADGKTENPGALLVGPAR